jgi:ABC-2 type transport system permease protein
MTGSRLFLLRWKNEWKFKIHILRSVVDWTIFLYLVIPGLIFFVIFYKDFWLHTSSYWMDFIPFWGLLGIMVMLNTGGNIRTFQYEADALHLLQENRLLFTLKTYGLMTTLLNSLITTGIIIGIALPVLLHIYHLNPVDICSLFINLFATKLLILTMKKIIHHKIIKRLILIASILIIVSIIHELPFYTTGIIGLLISMVLISYLSFKVNKNRYLFMRELEIEQEERNKYIQWIYQISSEIEKESVLYRKKPLLLFRNSARIFQERNEETGLLELLLKSFLRNRQYVMSYYRMLAISCVAILLFPLWVKLGLFIAYFFFIDFWISHIVKKSFDHPFFKLVAVKEDVKLLVTHRFQKIVRLPGLLIIGGLVVVFSLLKLIEYLIF